jgi:hypothetical protein
MDSLARNPRQPSGGYEHVACVGFMEIYPNTEGDILKLLGPLRYHGVYKLQWGPLVARKITPVCNLLTNTRQPYLKLRL